MSPRPPPPAATAPAPGGLSHERKVVTVLFADLVGSTELARSHDAEQLRSLLASFFEEMAVQIRAFGGTVEKYAGDAILAVFGVPRVGEDDAERAVRAALAMQRTVAELNPTFAQDYGVELGLRVGIATGEAVAATDDSRELLVTGEVANLAARLQAASPGVLLAEATHHLVAPLIDSAPLGPLQLKGFDPVMAYVVTGLRQTPGRRRGIPGLSSPLVGRAREMETLRGALEDLASGRGRIVVLAGEAGLGKSRLKIELRENLPEGIRWLEGRCYAHTRTTNYAPVSQILRSAFQLRGDEPPAATRTKLRAALRMAVGDRYERVRPVVGHLLEVGLEPGEADVRLLAPQALQSQLAFGLRALIEGLSARTPVVVAVEDLHWADTATIELLTVLMELVDFLPFTILVTCRPEAETGAWELRFHAQRNYPHRLTEIHLGPLDRDDADRLIGSLLGQALLPPALQSRIQERAEGNPLFVEEIVRALIDAQGAQREQDGGAAAAEVDVLALPETLRGVIAARVDRLAPEVKRTLQRASVIGRVFTYGSLEALAEDADDLPRHLSLLLRADLVRERAALPEREYHFKHALTQDAAYRSLLGGERRELHRKVALHFEQAGAAALGEQAAVLAAHWLEAEEPANALRYTLAAARRAAKLYAQPEAIDHYWQALALLDRLPETEELRRDRIQTLVALLNLPGFARDATQVDEAMRHLEQMMAAAAELGDQASLAMLESRKAFLTRDEGLHQRAIARAESCAEPVAWSSAINTYVGYLLGPAARYEEALPLIRQVIETAGARGDRWSEAYLMAAAGRCYNARAGRLEESLAFALRARETAEELGDPRLRAWCAMVAEPYMYQGRWEELAISVERYQPAAWEIGEWNVALVSSGWLAIAYVKLGRLDDAERAVERAQREKDSRRIHPLFTTYLEIGTATLQLALGRVEDAVKAARTALALAQGAGLRLEEGAAHRVLAQALEAVGDREGAAAAFGSSQEVLETIQSRPELAQTLLAFGRFSARDDAARGQALQQRALALFDAIGAGGWAEETRAALRAADGP